MEFTNRILDLAEKALDLKEQLQTEEATKNALIMPFINILGYDVFNPKEVVPEFTADIGTKKGEKVDYAIQKDGSPIIIVECKSCNQTLENSHMTQLYRYFSVTRTRFSVLTNGLVYLFYTDLDEPNIMDQKPFLEFDLLNVKESVVEELQKFSKESFNVDHILSTASELKYTREIRQILLSEYDNPSEEFVRYFVSQLYPGRMTQTVREQFTALTRRAFHQLVNEKISDRLKSVFNEEVRAESSVEPVPEAQSSEGAVYKDDKETELQIHTTEEELHAYYLVKTIVREVVEPQRVVIRDRVSYCGVLLDDNNRKPICRLHFNSAQKYLGLFDAQKNEERLPIQSLDDIYQFADRLKAVIGYYDNPSESEDTATVDSFANEEIQKTETKTDSH